MVIGLLTAPVMVFSITTFVITYKQRKLPQIHSLILAIGYSLLTFAQFIRNIWIEMGPGFYGKLWIGELFELCCLGIIAFGYLKPAPYAIVNKKKFENSQQTIIKKQDPDEHIQEITLEKTVISNEL